jgi:hypothetical protein
METSVVRQRLLVTLDRARQAARERRARIDRASHEFEGFLERLAVPLCRQLAQILKAEHITFTVFTPSGAVRLASERSGDDYVELALDASGDTPCVVGHTRRTRGGRVIDRTRPVRDCPVGELTEDEVLAFLLKELEPFLER